MRRVCACSETQEEGRGGASPWGHTFRHFLQLRKQVIQNFQSLLMGQYHASCTAVLISARHMPPVSATCMLFCSFLIGKLQKLHPSPPPQKVRNGHSTFICKASKSTLLFYSHKTLFWWRQWHLYGLHAYSAFKIYFRICGVWHLKGPSSHIRIEKSCQWIGLT
jgi:hypothetical protein